MRVFYGNDREEAENIFDKLAGTPVIQKHHILLVELVEELNGTPVNRKVLGCTLAQLTENSRMITCETFRLCSTVTM